MIGKEENSRLLDVYEALDTGLHSTDVFLLGLFYHDVRWESYKGGTEAQRGLKVTKPASRRIRILLQSF